MNIEELCVNNLRTLSMDMINKANSGHPGIALGAAPILFSLYTNILHVSPKKPKHMFRDRFVLSAGHGSSILYSTLHACGFNAKMEDLKSFRQLNSVCPGHPEHESENGVDATTGPLGQGIANAVGMAIAEKHVAATFNKPEFDLIDNFTYVLCGDGCLMEGVANEALSLAGTLKLNKLVVLYDFNKITIDGKIDVAFKQNTKQVMLGYGFNVIEVKNGNSVKDITNAIIKARKSKKPSFIIVNTIIGYGSPMANSNKVHGKPLGEQDTIKLKENLGINVNEFELLPEVKQHFSHIKEKYDVVLDLWEQKLKAYKEMFPQDYKELLSYYNNNYENVFTAVKGMEEKETSTRVAGGEVLNKIANSQKNIIGGCADVYASTMAGIVNSPNFNSDASGRNIMFGIREFAMAAIANGIALYGGLVPFVSTFLVFGDYLKNAIRMSAMQKLKVLYILTHDSLYVGEDGPTHQPIEQLPMFRSIPNTYVFRPCDYAETKASFAIALNLNAPSVIVETRQNLKMLQSNFESVKRGAYVIKPESGHAPKVVIIATGSEVELAINVANKLEKNNVSTRVVSMPCKELFDQNNETYKNKILPNNAFMCSIELSSDESFYKYVGKNGIVFGIKQFGASGKAGDVVKHFKFDEENIYKKIMQKIK